MKLVDVPDSKSGGAIRAGSSPAAGTTFNGVRRKYEKRSSICNENDEWHDLWIILNFNCRCDY